MATVLYEDEKPSHKFTYPITCPCVMLWLSHTGQRAAVIKMEENRRKKNLHFCTYEDPLMFCGAMETVG